VEHLLAHGRRRIAAIVGDRTRPGSEGALRLAGYQTALADAGLPYDPGLVADAAFGSESGTAAVRKLLRDAPDLDAIFVAYSDSVAIAGLRALMDAGKKVPQDVAVVGFDNIQLAEMTNPSLTTIDQGIEWGAPVLVEQLIRQLNGMSASPLAVEGELVIRESCGPQEEHERM
jgi:DNA-binding LacI/PurR family transcriptional regulator